MYGQIIAVVLSICQALFTPAPISEGEAHASFDDAGKLIVTTDSEKNGGGTANYWMEQLAKGAQLAGLQTPQAGAYTVGMPTVGYKYNPEGFNYKDKDGEQINGQLVLRWTDANGVAHERYYDSQGNDGLKDSKFGGERTMAEDFFTLMQDATKRYPPLAYEQLDGGVLQLDYGVATVVYATNTHKFDGMAEHIHGGEADTDAAQDEAIVIAEGDKRLIQDDSNTIANSSKQTHVKVAASDLHTVLNPANPIIAPIQTRADVIGAGSSKLVSNAIVTRPLGFVPLGGTDSLTQEKKNATAAMIQWPALAGAGTANCYILNSKLGNKYAGYSLKKPSKPAYLLKNAKNDELFTLAA